MQSRDLTCQEGGNFGLAVGARIEYRPVGTIEPRSLLGGAAIPTGLNFGELPTATPWVRKIHIEVFTSCWRGDMKRLRGVPPRQHEESHR